MWCNGNTKDFGSFVQGSSPCVPANLNLYSMSTFFVIMLIIAFVGIVLLALAEGISTHQQLSQYSQDILDEANYYFKSNPVITCKILAVSRTGYEKPNMTIEVTYPDKSVGELITPMTEFQQLWVKDE